jgi:NDP-sugar pyrophosphorylase family protein
VQLRLRREWLRAAASCSFGKGCSFGEECSFGANCYFGKGSRFGEECSFGEGCSFGGGSSFGEECSFGEGCYFGEGCAFEKGRKPRNWRRPFVTVGGIGSAGRTVYVFDFEDGLMIRAECFFGTEDELLERLRLEEDPHKERVYLAAVELAKLQFQSEGSAQ